MIVRAEHISHILDELPDKFHQLLDDLLAFVDKADPQNRAFQQSTTKELRFLLAYHLCKNTLLVSRDWEGGITGVITWYQMKSPWTSQQLQRWRPDDADGGEIIVSHMVAFNADARATLMKGLSSRIERFREKSIFALRRDKVVSFGHRQVDRFKNINSRK